MKIRNLNKGRDYQLSPDTTLQIERTNPFFSEYGEQSLPVDLPDTPLNRELTGHPEDLAGSRRPESGVPVEIIDGEYHVRAQQRVLSAKRNEKISTSYLLAQSELYAIVGDTQLIDVFANETVPGTEAMTLDQKISWLDGLKNHNDPNFDVFPVVMNNSAGGSPSFGYTFLNARGVLFTWRNDSNKQYFWPYPRTDAGQGPVSRMLWLNAEDRTRGPKIMSDVSLNVQKGFYMSPFVRAIHVLSKIISYFDYTLEYDSDIVIDKMVLVNNTIDSMVADGGIFYSDLVPDCSCSDLLDLFRYKFNMEFVCDSATMKVVMLPFSKMLHSDAVDITSYANGQPDIEYREAYRRLVLAPSGAIAGDVAIAVRETLKKHASPRWDPLYGGWVVDGHQGYNAVTEFVADGTTGYNIGGEQQLETEELKSPDKIPALVFLNDYNGDSNTSSVNKRFVFPCIGDERALHSRLSSDLDDTSELQERPKLDMMVLLPYNDYRGFPRGTLTNWDYYRFYDAGARVKIKSDADYTLCYHGNDGLFARYWRVRDDLLRNALNKVRVSLVLPDSLKMSISPLNRVLLHGSPFLIDTLNIVLGQDDVLQESTLLTETLQEPISHAVETEDIIPVTGYHWELRCVYRLTDENAYNLARYYLPQTDHLFNPSKSFPAAAASADNVGEECCVQHQLVKLNNNDYILFRYGIDGVDSSLENMSYQGQIFLMPSYLENRSGHAIYLNIESKLVCVADQV